MDVSRSSRSRLPPWSCWSAGCGGRAAWSRRWLFGLLIGGALGNASDRLTHGAVADFLYFHTPFSLGPLSNYVFNLADAAIFVGVVLLVYEAATRREADGGA